ncbi:MAG: nucleoside hydrolase [Eubacteriales bacterium]|nr:nucleoside hydrolase [Eubacteriales bacterium]
MKRKSILSVVISFAILFSASLTGLLAESDDVSDQQQVVKVQAEDLGNLTCKIGGVEQELSLDSCSPSLFGPVFQFSNESYTLKIVFNPELFEAKKLEKNAFRFIELLSDNESDRGFYQVIKSLGHDVESAAEFQSPEDGSFNVRFTMTLQPSERVIADVRPGIIENLVIDSAEMKLQLQEKNDPRASANVIESSEIQAKELYEEYDVVTSAKTHKVIFDTDMGYLNDDAIALFTLLQADRAGWLDLLGVTTVGGNELIATGTAATLNQLERLGRTDVPVYIGTDVPLGGFRDLALESKVYGSFLWTGAYRELEHYTRNYKELGELQDDEWGIPETDAAEGNASDFMIEQVHKYPGQVTIFAVGACTNVALAIMKDPNFAKNAAGIVYMGGAIDVPGNASVLAEFNWWYDPDSVDICLRADWPQQIIVPHDVAPKVIMAKDVYDQYVAMNTSEVTELLVEKLGPGYEANPTKTSYCWDPITVGVFLCPELITESEVRDVVMDVNRGFGYGQSVSWRQGKGPYTAATCEIIFNIDRDAFWTFLAKLFAERM